MTPDGPRLRSFEPADAAALARVCLLTAEAGGDATGLYVTDELMPDVFARPYVAFAPELATVVEDEQGVGGYLLAVADTAAFVDWFRGHWVPEVIAARYTHTEPVAGRDDLIRHLAFTPERMLVPELADFPAHLHIDLLPRLQGRGLGRRLIGRLAEQLRERGVPGVHLGMDPVNTAARAFYDRLGFAELPSSTPEGPLLGLRV